MITWFVVFHNSTETLSSGSEFTTAQRNFLLYHPEKLVCDKADYNSL